MNSRVAPIAHVVNFSAARVGVGALSAFTALSARLTGRAHRHEDLRGEDPASLLWRRNMHIKTADAFDDEDEIEEYSLA